MRLTLPARSVAVAVQVIVMPLIVRVTVHEARPDVASREAQLPAGAVAG